MKIKVPFFSRKIWREYAATIAILSAFASITLIFIEIPAPQKLIYLIVAIVTLVVIYLLIWIRANLKRSAKLDVNSSTLVIKSGDIFKEVGLRVIAFNEYFDTLADDVIIARNSLNGVYLSTLNSTEIAQLDRSIKNDLRLKDRTVENVSGRQLGKKIKYRLGSVFVNGDFLLVAFSHFDSNNRATLTLKEYVGCLMNMWDEIDQVYGGRSVVIPLMGSGITRFKDAEVQPTELLDILIWTFKVSRVKFPYPAKATIIIHDSIADKINFYQLNI